MQISTAINESVLHICDVLDTKVDFADSIEGEIYGSSIPVYEKTEEGEKEIQFFLYFKKTQNNYPSYQNEHRFIIYICCN